MSYADRERAAWAACERDLAVLRGRSVSFCSDSMLELSLARTLRAAGMLVKTVGTPNIYRKFHALERARLDGVEILERPDRFALFARLSEDRPDLVVANLNIANALEGMGFNVKWSTELTFQPIHGFNGAPSLLGMFAASMRRHDAVARTRDRSQTARDADRPLLLPRAGSRVKLALWAYQAPAHVGVCKAAASFANIHAVLRAPKGDGYGTIMLAMFERLGVVPPISVCAMSEATLAGAPANLPAVLREVDARLHPEMLVVTRSATAAVLQEPLDGEIAMLAPGDIKAEIFQASAHPVRDNEVSAFAKTAARDRRAFRDTTWNARARPSVNIFGPSLLGFHDHANVDIAAPHARRAGHRGEPRRTAGRVAGRSAQRGAGLGQSLDRPRTHDADDDLSARPLRNADRRRAAVRRSRDDRLSARVVRTCSKFPARASARPRATRSCRGTLAPSTRTRSRANASGCSERRRPPPESRACCATNSTCRSSSSAPTS